MGIPAAFTMAAEIGDVYGLISQASIRLGYADMLRLSALIDPLGMAVT